MLSDRLKQALIDQMNHEFAAAHEYLAMASYCENRSYDGFANFYKQQAKEARYHGTKIYNYLNDRGVHAKFQGIPEPKNEYDSLLDTFKQGLEQERTVTKNFYQISDIATEDREHMTLSFVRWFLDEQVEEEAMFETHIDYLERLKDDGNALYVYEQDMAKRQFDVPEE